MATSEISASSVVSVLPPSGTTLQARSARERLHDAAEAALGLLRDTITGDGQVAFVIVPVASYGLGVWCSSEPIDCICIGPISSSTFYALASQRLRKAASKGVRLARRIRTPSGRVLELEVAGIGLLLRYAPSRSIVEGWPQVMQLPHDDAVFALPRETLITLKPVRDLYHLQRTVPDLGIFRNALREIKAWARLDGVYAERFGYLGDMQIAMMLSRACKTSAVEGSTTVQTVVKDFFDHYATFDWAKDMVCDPSSPGIPQYTRTDREPMVVMGFHGPNPNTAPTATASSVKTITEELREKSHILSDEWTWSPYGTKKTFLQAFSEYIKVDLGFWGVSSARGGRFVSWLESRCEQLFSDLNWRMPHVHFRIWPARFVTSEVAISKQDNADYQACYLVGLGRSSTTEKDESLQALLRKFEGQIHEDDHFDAKSCWMSASVVKRADLRRAGLRLDDRHWAQYIVGDDESDDEEEEDDSNDDDDDDEREKRRFDKPKSKRASNAKQPPPAGTGPQCAGKFRSSADVLNRIRWDASMDSSDHIVGYEDRFLGTKERALDLWKAEQTDEEFIPQHRILYFRRQSDGAVVWDRRSRRDEVFGSGVRVCEGD